MADARAANAVDKRLGARVRARRLELEFSQERLASLIGVTFQQIQKYELGTNRISAARLLLIARALDAPVSRFFEGIEVLGPGQTGAGAADDVASLEFALAAPGATELVLSYAKIENPKVRSRVLKLVRAMVKE